MRESEEDTGVLPAAYTDLVAQLLGNLGLEQYAEAFSAEKLLYSQLPQVTNEELKEMGIPLGPRKRLLAAFAEIDVGGADVASLPSKLKRQSDAAELPSVLRITTIREKPTREYAMKNLLMSNPSLPPDTFLTAFGQYVLTPQIFQVLEDNISQNIRQQGAFQLTDALDNLRKDQVRHQSGPRCLSRDIVAAMVRALRGLPLTLSCSTVAVAGTRWRVCGGEALQHREPRVVRSFIGTDAGGALSSFGCCLRRFHSPLAITSAHPSAKDSTKQNP